MCSLSQVSTCLCCTTPGSLSQGSMSIHGILYDPSLIGQNKLKGWIIHSLYSAYIQATQFKKLELWRKKGQKMITRLWQRQQLSGTFHTRIVLFSSCFLLEHSYLPWQLIRSEMFISWPAHMDCYCRMLAYLNCKRIIIKKTKSKSLFLSFKGVALQDTRPCWTLLFFLMLLSWALQLHSYAPKSRMFFKIRKASMPTIWTALSMAQCGLILSYLKESL